MPTQIPHCLENPLSTELSTMSRLITLLSLVAAFALAGCNTVHGLGKDIEKAGEAISGAASK